MTSDCSKSVPPLPKETSRAANAIFGRSNFYIVIGEYLDAILENVQLHEASEKECAERLEWVVAALITFFQFVEGLTDVQAVDAVRTRVDWKFALHLPLVPPSFHENMFCEFRQGILKEAVSHDEFQQFVERLTAFVPSLRSNFNNIEGSAIVASVCSINRLDRAQQAMDQALETLAARFPDWLRKIALPHWYGRYNRTAPRLEVAVLLGQQRFLMEEIGADIHHLLRKVHQSGSHELAELREVKSLNQIWLRQFKGLNLMPNHWPENLSLKDCNTCTFKGAGRRQSI